MSSSKEKTPKQRKNTNIPSSSTSTQKSDQRGQPSQTNHNGSDNNTRAQRQQDLEFNFKNIIQMAFQTFVFIYLISWFFKGSSQTSEKASNSEMLNNSQQPGANGVPTHDKVLPYWQLDSNINLRVYVSENENFDQFNDPDALVWHAANIRFGNWNDEREKSLEIPTSPNVQKNGTLYAHIYLTLEQASPNPQDHAYEPNMLVYKRKCMSIITHLGTLWLEKNSSNKDRPIVSHWCQNLTLNIVSDNVVLPYSQFPPVITSEISLEVSGKKDPSGKHGYYLPIVYINDFWILKEHMTSINETVRTLPLTVKFYPLSFLKFQMYAQMQESFQVQAELLGGNAHSEFDEFKRMLLETNPILLGVTFFVSLLHNISDWKNRKEMTGISIRTIFMNIFFQLIIFLYLFDNNEETSWMILIGQGIGLAIEIWKIKKALAVEIKPSQNTIFPYSIRFVDRHQLSELEKKTKEYDQLAFRYLSWIAHMPWKTLMYKTLGTFIDDLFAFCIKMPMLHRLACLRDDVVFFVYLYQRWIYPVDEKRANEYGQVGSEPETEQPNKIINGHDNDFASEFIKA
ncbi:4361_t:CDS:10 [Ambispora gerdemannii]|uniref:4361_t:CDS:1 n=1 Tax=Ambispora gerdemannii TaxID=144530 RepID=A0A9N8VNW8_9GLOM|nr:4361_t:CDS:10 [Ambispora gerdemannii]